MAGAEPAIFSFTKEIVMEATKSKKGAVVMPDRMGLAEHKRNDWVVDVEVGLTVEDIQEPSFWSLVAEQMAPLDKVEVRPDDGRWIAELRVIRCERTYALMQLERVLEIKQNAETLPQSIKHRVEYKGAHYKNSVIRIADNQILQHGFKTREEAEMWLRSYEKR